MSEPKPKITKARTSPKGGAMYRGIRLQPMATGSQFTSEQVRRAVESALAKHANDLAGKG